MLDISNVVQTNRGSTGSTGVSSFNVTLPSPATAGNLIVMCVGGTDADITTPSGYLSVVGQNFGGSTFIYGDFYANQAAGGETTITVSFDAGGPGLASWWVAEVAGLASAEAGVLGYPTATDYMINGFQNYNGGFLDVLDSGSNLGLSLWGDDLVLGVAMCTKNNVAPPLVSGTPVSTTNDATAPAWTRSGTTTTTTRTVGGANVRLDMFYAFGDGPSHNYNLAVTWADTTATGLLCAVVALKSFWVAPQATQGRAATNSMTF